MAGRITPNSHTSNPAPCSFLAHPDIASIKHQFIFLKKMRFLLGGGVHTDAFAIIDSIRNETRLNSHLTYTWLKDSYQNSQSKRIELDCRFHEVKKSLVNHLDKRICKLGLYLLNHNTPSEAFWISKKNEVQDLWMSISLPASLHVSDVLFNAQQFLNNINEKSEDFVKHELNPFIEKSLPLYLSLLPDITEEFKLNLIDSFESLKISISLGNADLARTQLLSIQVAIF